MSDPLTLPAKTQTQDYPYFRRLWKTTVITLLAASFIPFFCVGILIYGYTSSVLREKTLEVLQAEVLQQKGVIDRFLAERTRELQLISNNLNLAHLSQPGVLNDIFNTLSRESPYFVDLGIIDDRGRHLAYVGPYDLLSKNYLTSDWYIHTMAHGIFVSDLFMGYRNIPHMVIAVKCASDDGNWIVRATIDGSYLDKIVKEISYQKNGEAYLVNRKGIYQTTPRTSGKIMARSALQDLGLHDGVKLEAVDNRLRLSAWLEKVPWISIVEIDKKEAFAALHRVRSLVIYIFILSSIIMTLAVLLTTNYLITRLESKRKSIQHLDHQLRHTSRVVTSATLSTGVFHKVKDCLANIDITAQWIKSAAGDSPKAPAEDGLHGGLRQIQSQILEARNAIEKYLRITDFSGPVIKEIHINRLLNDLMDLLEWDVKHKQAEVVKDFDETAASFRSDPTTVRHIIQNLIHNALEAMPPQGRLSLTTRADKQGVRVTVSDTGPGIPHEDRDRIFEPFFSTKTRSLGLGLSVSKSVVEKLGGSLSFESRPGEGAAFTVFFPYRIPHDQT